MQFHIANDHAACNEKRTLQDYLGKAGDVINHGTDSDDSCDYPDFAQKVALAVQNDEQSKGVLSCGSGIGVSMVANRFKGVRAALCRTTEDAKMSRLHNNSNVICFGARTTSVEQMLEILDVWLNTEFEGDRHQRRISKFDQLGQ